jgi:3-oxoacyl-[acyl-carrier protein] reductase
LAGKVGIVTGASRGIGCGIAEVLGQQGMRLVLTARSADKGEAFAAKLKAVGVDCLWATADVSTSDGAKAVFDAAIERYGRVHLLVNNAAHLASRPILRLDEEWYRKSFELNVRMVYGLSYLLSRHMVESGGGCIINISSVGGLRAHHGLAGYDASKGAIDALTRSMASDLAPHRIRVNAVAPGLTVTRVVEERWVEMLKKKAEGIPLGRVGTGEDIGLAVAFLASEAASYITGQILYVDGGLTMQLTPPGIHI